MTQFSFQSVLIIPVINSGRLRFLTLSSVYFLIEGGVKAEIHLASLCEVGHLSLSLHVFFFDLLVQCHFLFSFDIC